MSVCALKVLDDGSQVEMDFGDLIEANYISISALADWCELSRQTIYKYIRGEINPVYISYVNITNIASFMDEEPVVVYNAIVKSFEDVHVWSEEQHKWIKPDVFDDSDHYV